MLFLSSKGKFSQGKCSQLLTARRHSVYHDVATIGGENVLPGLALLHPPLPSLCLPVSMFLSLAVGIQERGRDAVCRANWRQEARDQIWPSWNLFVSTLLTGKWSVNDDKCGVEANVKHDNNKEENLDIELIPGPGEQPSDYHTTLVSADSALDQYQYLPHLFIMITM